MLFRSVFNGRRGLMLLNPTPRSLVEPLSIHPIDPVSPSIDHTRTHPPLVHHHLSMLTPSYFLRFLLLLSPGTICYYCTGISYIALLGIHPFRMSSPLRPSPTFYFYFCFPWPSAHHMRRSCVFGYVLNTSGWRPLNTPLGSTMY